MNTKGVEIVKTRHMGNGKDVLESKDGTINSRDINEPGDGIRLEEGIRQVYGVGVDEHDRYILKILILDIVNLLIFLFSNHENFF